MSVCVCLRACLTGCFWNLLAFEVFDNVHYLYGMCVGIIHTYVQSYFIYNMFYNGMPKACELQSKPSDWNWIEVEISVDKNTRLCYCLFI